MRAIEFLRSVLGLVTLVTGLTAVVTPDCARAVEFTPDALDDRPDIDPGDGLCASDVGTCTLRAAVMEANAQPGEDTINLSGFSFPFFSLTIPRDPGAPGSTGPLLVTDDLVVESPGGAEIRGSLETSGFEATATARLSLSGIALLDGGSIVGGLNAAHPVLIYNSSLNEASCTCSYVRMEATSAIAAAPGNVLVQAAGPGRVELVNSNLVSLNGNGVLTGSDVSVVVQGTSMNVEEGTSIALGGPASDLLVEDSNLSGYGSGSAGIVVSGSWRSFEVRRSVVGGANLGALVVTSTDPTPGPFVVRDTLIQDSYGDLGGALTFVGATSAASPLVFANVTFTKSGGGVSALYFDGAGSPVHALLSGVTIARNFSTALAIANAPEVTESDVFLKGSLVAGNPGDPCFVEGEGLALRSLGGNLIEFLEGCPFEALPSDQAPLLFDDRIDAQIGGDPSPDLGGFPWAIPLLPGSPAIDAAECSDPRDQRGFPRPVDGNGDGIPGCDVGAFEYVPAAADADADTVFDGTDNCPTVANADQSDGDADGVGDACDNCVVVANPRRPSGETLIEPWISYTGFQRDDDHDGYGNRCDAKFPGVAGSLVGSADLAELRASNGKSRATDTCGTTGTLPCAIFDLDEQGSLIGTGDLTRFRQLNGKPAGPKCPACPLLCDAGAEGTCAPLF